MMVSDEESVRRFVRKEISYADLSTLTLGVLKGRYLRHMGGVTLSPDQQKLLKRVVEAELLNMQKNQTESELSERAATGEAAHHTLLKRKREEEEEEEEEETTTKAKTKKSRQDKSPEMLWEKRAGKRPPSGEEEEEEDDEEEEKEEEETQQTSSGSEEDRPLQRRKQPISLQSRRDDQSEEGNNKEEEEEDSSSDEQAPARKGNKEGAGPATGGMFPGDSDSSSLPSLDEEEEEVKKPKVKAEPNEKAEPKQRKRRSKVKEESNARDGKEEHKSVSRLKHYIALCGARRNYKKLLSNCHSVETQVTTLKTELEALGVHGHPSVKKCKIARLKREEAQELAGLDMSNIIATEGRPRRQAPRSASKRLVDSDSPSTRGSQSATDWSRLRGIISDEDSDCVCVCVHLRGIISDEDSD
ncbi:HIRA-interacting protein 3 isoform X5 [Alosa alosa]|uniref:HIRA-interacting protein 3 isoform X4 n=1 Tax=Alosa alosa TaxID=278164 RepID=UPI002015500D|nr:HIRA-interacting protein 3 isoform X4 [Alosa alosa]XP_048089554.1 HIRA-interacting protein 3 isoform X5 [Alosa alosa]